jgi:hypothetical protein
MTGRKTMKGRRMRGPNEDGDLHEHGEETKKVV